MGFVASVCQPSTLRMLIWPDASSAQNNIAAVSRQHGLCLDPSFELLVQSLNCIRRPRAAPLAWRQAVDEKSQIQTLDRPQPNLPMKPGRAGTMTHDYTRHGTTMLFAALNILDGHCHSNTLAWYGRAV